MGSESEQKGREYGVSSTALIVAIVLAGIFLIWVGQLNIIYADWEDGEGMETTVRTSMTLISFGGVLTSSALIAGGIFSKSIDKFVRLGMLVAAAFMTWQLMTWSGTYIPWTYLIR